MKTITNLSLALLFVVALTSIAPTAHAQAPPPPSHGCISCGADDSCWACHDVSDWAGDNWCPVWGRCDSCGMFGQCPAWNGLSHDAPAMTKKQQILLDFLQQQSKKNPSGMTPLGLAFKNSGLLPKDHLQRVTAQLEARALTHPISAKECAEKKENTVIAAIAAAASRQVR